MPVMNDVINVQETSIYCAPYAFIDKRGEPVLIKLLGEKHHSRLLEMYLNYQPRNSFNGLPPIQDKSCKIWVENMIKTGINLTAFSFDRGIIGHAALFPINTGACEMLIVVSQDHQLVGIGTALNRCAIQLAYEVGFENVWLCVEQSNQVARHVYRKCGFQYLRNAKHEEVEMTFDLKRYHQTLDAPVREITSKDVVSIRRDRSCSEAIALCLEKHVSALPVVNRHGEVVGIITATDLLTATNFNQRISDVITTDVVTVKEDCQIAKVVRLLQTRGLRAIPVVDSGKKLVGIVGRREVLTYYQKNLQSGGQALLMEFGATDSVEPHVGMFAME